MRTQSQLLVAVDFARWTRWAAPGFRFQECNSVSTLVETMDCIAAKEEC